MNVTIRARVGPAEASKTRLGVSVDETESHTSFQTDSTDQLFRRTKSTTQQPRTWGPVWWQC